MHAHTILSTLLLTLSFQLAASASVRVAPRPPCTASLLSSPPAGSTCNATGTLADGGPAPFYSFSDRKSTNDANIRRCAIECRRDPRCVSWSYARPQCALYTATPTALGFAADPAARRVVSSRECFVLQGDCLVENGSFEDRPLDVHHPWVFVDDGGFSLRRNGGPGATAFSPTPDGRRFVGVVDNPGTRAVRARTVVNLELGKVYLFNQTINFASYSRTGDGDRDPDGYLIDTKLCGETIDLFQRNPLGANNTWIRNGGSVFQVPNECRGLPEQVMEIEWSAIKTFELGEQFISTFGFDDISFNFCGGPRSLCDRFYPPK